MKVVGLVALAAGVAFGIGFFAGVRSTDQSPNPDADSGEGVAASMAKMARALERVETKLPAAAPTLATRHGASSAGLSNADITEMLAGIAKRLDRLSSAQGKGFTPETSRERTTEQVVSLGSLVDEEAQAIQRKHFMGTGHDLLERYGVPDRASYWTGATIRWIYRLGYEAPSAGARVVFELIDGYVTAAFVEREP